MSKISGYLILNNPLGDDILIGTDIHNSNVTKNFSIQSLFDIGLDLTTSKINIYDNTIEDYGEITLDNDVFRVKGAPTNTRNLLVSSATGYLSFKKNSSDVKLDATANTDSRTYVLPDTNGTIALTSDLRPYKVFTALLTQTGVDTEDSINSGLLTIGVTYIINENSPGMNFTNVGAPNNNLGTSFIATGTTPTSWGSGATYTLAYSAGAPIATILENTIGNIWFTYQSTGMYKANFSTEQNINKLYASAIPSYNNDYNFIGTYFSNTFVGFTTLNTSFVESDGWLSQTPIEIRVYN